MAAVSVSSCVRFGRLFAENILHVTRLSNHRIKLSASVNNKNWITIRNFTTPTSENVQGKQVENEPELSESEKKLKNDIENLNKEMLGLTEKIQSLEDKYKRSLADGENLRIRLSKQIEDAKIYGIQSFCKDLLEVSDILQKAIGSVPQEEINDKNPHLKSLYEGLVMTDAQLQNVFKRHGLVSVNPINEKFNPNLHEALFQQEIEGKESGIVVAVSKVGYKLHERVIRPALVGVSKCA